MIRLVQSSRASVLTLATLLPAAALAAPLGTAFTYQGQLKQSGSPVNGPVDLDFSLWNDEIATDPGNQIGTIQSLAGVSVTNGLFTVQLNGGGEFGASAFNGEARWLNIVVNGETLSPRQPLTATPYAVHALTTDNAAIAQSISWNAITDMPPDFADGVDNTDSLWLLNGSNIYLNGGNVGMGTSTPASKLDIAATGDGAELLRLSTERPWVFRQVGTGSGAFLQLQSTVGLKNFQITAQGGTNIATFDANDASPKLGVARYPPTYTLDVRAVAGIRLGLDGNGGGALVMANNANDNRIYLEAFNSAGNGSANEMILTGFNGQPLPLLTMSANTTQMLGKVNVVTSTGTLGLEHTDGTRRISTYVSASGGWLGTVSNDPLKFFVNDGVSSMAINTDTTVDIGGHLPLAQLSVVAGSVQTAIKGQASGYGVYGTGGLYGVFSNGNLSASGTKSFRMDHPSDPENRYLLHYCAEGPEPLNLYTGTVTTDAKGEAWVQLPAYCEAINKDFRYTLTVVDDSDSETFVQAKVAREIRNNRFKIRTSAGTTKVSWEVKGTRNDLWVRSHGAPVEVEKDKGEKGKYQHPDLYGQPPEKGIDFRTTAPVATAR